MKTIYEIMVLIFLMQTVLLSQVEVVSSKNTLDAKIKDDPTDKFDYDQQFYFWIKQIPSDVLNILKVN